MSSHNGSLWAAFRVLVVVVLVVQLLGCGTILYPERRGQPAGKYDTDIVILDAIGLVFFLVPGVIAFAVDFSTGAIYLPKGKTSKTREILGQTEIRQLELRTRDAAGIAAVIEEQTGQKINLHSASVTILKGRDGDDLGAQLHELNAGRSDVPEIPLELPLSARSS
jgi:hypothetical protein